MAVEGRVVAERGDDARPVAAPEAAQRGDVHVVVVIMGEQDCVDGRQIGQCDARRLMAARAGEGERTGAVGPDWIDQDVVAGTLHEQRGMADHGDTESFGAGRGMVDVSGAGGGGTPGGGDTGATPAQEVAQGAVGGSGAGVEEADTVEVVGGLGHGKRGDGREGEGSKDFFF